MTAAYAQRGCLGCGALARDQIGSSQYYRCDAERLPDPNGVYHALPSHAGARGVHLHRFGRNDHATRVERIMAPGPVEGCAIDRESGQRRPCTYRVTPCPARRP